VDRDETVDFGVKRSRNLITLITPDLRPILYRSGCHVQPLPSGLAMQPRSEDLVGVASS